MTTHPAPVAPLSPLRPATPPARHRLSPQGLRARGPRWYLAVVAAGLLPGVASAAAQCPASTPTTDVQPFLSGQVLTCSMTPMAPPTCPPTHPSYQVRQGRDSCHVALTKPPITEPTVVRPVCPAHMELQVDWGSQLRDRCRGLLSAIFTPTAGQLQP